MNPAALAEKCFALARSTTHAGERQAAIDRGLAICARHRLDPDRYDIPGRRRSTPPRPSPAASLAERLNSVAAAFAAALARAEAREGETIYDARRRNFEQACADARARDAARGSGA